MKYQRKIKRVQTRRIVRRRIRRQKIALTALIVMLGITAVLYGGLMLKKRLPEEARASEKENITVYSEKGESTVIEAGSVGGLEKDQTGNNFTTTKQEDKKQVEVQKKQEDITGSKESESLATQQEENLSKEIKNISKETENTDSKENGKIEEKTRKDTEKTPEKKDTEKVPEKKDTEKVPEKKDTEKKTEQKNNDQEEKQVSNSSSKENEKVSTEQDKTDRAAHIKELEQQLEERIKTTAFIGNSRTEGLQINNKSCKADFFCYRGLMVNTAGKKDLMKLKSGGKGTVLDALNEGSYTDIFIMFGVNELGWKSTELFRDYYVELIEDIKKQQPNATIYIQSILPVTKETSKSDKIYNNTNVKLFNAMVIEAAEEAGVIYLDVATELCGKGNPLPTEAAAKDGIHLTKEYCERWYEYLLEQMVEN